MAKKRPKKKPPTPVGNRVPNPSNGTLGGKFKQSILAGVMARYAYPTIAHVAGLPGRMGVGLADEPTQTNRMAPPSEKALPAFKAGALARSGSSKSAYKEMLRPAPPPILSRPSTTYLPTPPAIGKPQPSISGPPPRIARTFGEQIRSAAKGVRPTVGKAGTIARGVGSAIGRNIGKAASSVNSAPLGVLSAISGGIAGHSLYGPMGIIPGAMVGGFLGGRPNHSLPTKNDKGEVVTDKEGNTVMEDAGKVPWNIHAGRTASVAGRGLLSTGKAGIAVGKAGVRAGIDAAKGLARTHGGKIVGEALGEGGRAIGEAAKKARQVIKDKTGFDNESLTTPSSHRTTVKLSSSKGRELMSNLRMANEHRQSSVNNALQKAAFEALRNRKIDTALDLVDLYKEESEGQPQEALGQAGGVALPSPGRIDESMTRDKRAKVGQMRASMDQMNNLSQGQSPQNPIGTDADEGLAMVPSSQRANPLPLSPGRKVMQELRQQKVMKQRMQRVLQPMPAPDPYHTY